MLSHAEQAYISCATSSHLLRLRQGSALPIRRHGQHAPHPCILAVAALSHGTWALHHLQLSQFIAETLRKALSRGAGSPLLTSDSLTLSLY